MKEISPGVYRATRVLWWDLEALKAEAARLPGKRARICLHESDDSPVQEMLVALCEDASVPIHRHDEFETITIVSGTASVYLYADDFGCTDILELGREVQSCAVGRAWHKVVPTCPVVVIHEVKHGTFKPMILP